MALYDGFFDAVLDEETEEYDRAYDSGDFTEYFNQIIGSGVCIHNNPSSFLARLEDGAVVLSPGYLFIQGYWLKNDSDLTVSLTGTAASAIVAHLNKGKKMIEVEARSVSQSYPDALVLGLVDPAAGTIVDTRYDTDICGVIDSAGGLSNKVQYAINYIDTQVDSKLSQIEADVLAQEDVLDEKIAEVESVVDQIAPPPIGSIKFSAAQDMGESWLKCDGRFVSGETYPELVEALGKLPAGAFEQTEVSQFLMQKESFSLCLLDNYLLVYSYKETPTKMYVVDLETGNVSEIAVTLTGLTFSSEIEIIQNISAVKNESRYTLYLTHSTGYSTYAANGNGTVAYVNIKYLCCENFDVLAQSVTFTAQALNQVPVNVPSEDLSTFPYFLGCDIYPSKVMAFDSVPYLSLGYIYFTNFDKTGHTYPSTSSTRAKKYLAVCSISQGAPAVVLHYVSTAAVKPVGTVNITPSDFNFGSLYNVVPDFAKGNGGCLYLKTGSNPIELMRLSGETEETLWRSGSVGESSIQVNNLPVLGKESVYIGLSVTNQQTNVSLIEFDKAGIQKATVSASVDNTNKEAAFLQTYGLFVFPSGGKLIFCSDLSDPDQYVLSPPLNDNDDLYPGTKQSTLIDEEHNKIYTFYIDALFTAHLYMISLPNDFNPINGTNLPTLSLSGIPAYIKAKEDMPS